MRALIIACGNPQRGDDGVAAHTLALLHPGDGARGLRVQQLTPELASELAAHDVVLIVDADLAAVRVRIDPVDETAPPSSALAHHCGAGELVAIARALFDWRGLAFTCALPVQNVDAGAPLSARARRSARTGARVLRRFLAAAVAPGGSGGLSRCAPPLAHRRSARHLDACDPPDVWPSASARSSRASSSSCSSSPSSSGIESPRA